VTCKIDRDDYAVVADCRTDERRTFVIDPQREPRKKSCVLVIDAAFGQGVDAAEQVKQGEGVAVFDRVCLVFGRRYCAYLTEQPYGLVCALETGLPASASSSAAFT
jgi:hypothetical protein